MPQLITCPHCRTVLSTNQTAPTSITCPRCLASVTVRQPPAAVNPITPQVQWAAPDLPQPADHEARADLVDSARLMLIVGIVMILTAMVALILGAESSFAMPTAVIGSVLLVGGVAFRSSNPGISFRPQPTRVAVAPDAPTPDEPYAPPSAVLHYQSPRDRAIPPPSTPLAGQVALGFAAWIMMVVATVMFIQSTPVARQAGPAPIFFGVIAAAIALAAWVRIRFHWRGFVPGLLIGFALTCLVPFGILLIICGGGRL